MSRRRTNPDQRVLIPALLLDKPCPPPEAYWSVTFAYDGITHIRHCPSRIYYETLLMLLPMFATDVQGSDDPPPAARGGGSKPRFAQQEQEDRRAAQ